MPFKDWFPVDHLKIWSRHFWGTVVMVSGLTILRIILGYLPPEDFMTKIFIWADYLGITCTLLFFLLYLIIELTSKLRNKLKDEGFIGVFAA